MEPEGPRRVTDQGSSSVSGWGLLRVLRMRTKSCARASAFQRSGKKSCATTCLEGSWKTVTHHLFRVCDTSTSKSPSVFRYRTTRSSSDLRLPETAMSEPKRGVLRAIQRTPHYRLEPGGVYELGLTPLGLCR